jgi:hypothetical protein
VPSKRKRDYQEDSEDQEIECAKRMKLCELIAVSLEISKLTFISEQFFYTCCKLIQEQAQARKRCICFTRLVNPD